MLIPNIRPTPIRRHPVGFPTRSDQPFHLVRDEAEWQYPTRDTVRISSFAVTPGSHTL